MSQTERPLGAPSTRHRPMLAAALIAGLLVPEPLAAAFAPVPPSPSAWTASGADLEVAAKAKRKKKSKKKKVARRGKRSNDGERERTLPREIRQEQDLSPKQEVKLDDQLGKTKALTVDTGGKGPSVDVADLLKTDAESLVDSKLNEEIELTQQLLDITDECGEASPARFRLADLYWEKSKRAFFQSNDLTITPQQRAKYEEQMKRLQAVSIESYEKIVTDCADYKDYAKTLYYLGKALMEGERPKEGATYFRRVIQEFPDSEWVPHSWFMVGEYYFNVANDALAALKAYGKAAEYPKSSMFAYSVYKQGWCYINTGDWDKALQHFKRVVTIAADEGQDLDARARLGLRNGALKDYVRAYSNVGDPKAALKTFYAIGGKDQLQSMLEQLGNWYTSRDGHHDTVVVFRDLIKSYPRSSRIAVYQGRIVDATSRMGDRKQTVAEARKLTEFFAELRARMRKGELNGDDKKTFEKDTRDAEEIAENTLRRLAFEYYKEATKLKGQAADRTMRLAHDLHRHYLEVFPEPKKDAEVNYVFYVRFQFADILYKLESFEEAAKNYEAVVEMNPHPTKPDEKKIVLIAAEEAVRSYDELVQDLDRTSPPEISGTEPKAIPPIKQKLIDSCLRYIQYVGHEGEKIVEIRYKMARIYYTYNHFDKAAPAFNDIVANHPTNDVACYAANLVLDIYNGRKDYPSLKTASRTYLDSKKLACGDEDKKRFAKIEESSSFLLIKAEYEDKKKHIAAGNLYMEFHKSFPKSEFSDDAVYNAAVNYDLGNKLDEANKVREYLVKQYPDSPLVPETLYNIAQSYERIVDFENAAKYLELFASKYPNDSKSKDAIYNAAVYRATLGDYAGGKAGRERYIQLYPREKDLHEVAFAICESLEHEAKGLEAQQKAGKNSGSAILAKWEQAHDCYYSYIKNGAYVRADTDMMCQAQYRRHEIMRSKTNYDKGAQELKKYILGNWGGWKRQGVEKLPRCAKAVAEIQLRDLEGTFKRYDDLTIAELNPADQGKKKFEASVKAKTVARDKLIEEYKGVVEIGVVEPALTALYYIGEAYRESVESLLRAPIPDKIPGYKLTNEDKQLLRDQLRQMVGDTESQAIEAYRVCVQKANEFGVYNQWSIRALDRLNKLRPDEYPLVVERVESVEFPARLVVQSNGIVIADGDVLKSIELRLAARAAPAKAVPAPVPAKPKPGATQASGSRK